MPFLRLAAKKGRETNHNIRIRKWWWLPGTNTQTVCYLSITSSEAMDIRRSLFQISNQM